VDVAAVMPTGIAPSRMNFSIDPTGAPPVVHRLNARTATPGAAPRAPATPFNLFPPKDL
jgi:hypothetical protein